MRFVLLALLACAACDFPRPPDVADDAAISPGQDAGTDTGLDADAGIPRCANLGYTVLPWPATGAAPFAITSADLNGDGKADLIVTNKEDNTVSVLLGNGNGTFRPKVDYATGPDPRAVAVADVNGDAKPDLVIGNNGTFQNVSVSVLIGNGNGTFGAKIDYPVSNFIETIAVADVSGDGKPDIVVATDTISVLLNNGNGTFAAKVDYSPGLLTPRTIAIGDMNGDGKPDIVAAAGNDNGNGVFVLPGNGNGTFAARIDFPISGTFSVFSLAIADINGDGKMDVATSVDRNSVSVLLGNGKGTFTSKIDSPTEAGPATLIATDINHDGKSDLVVAGVGTSVMLGNGNGTFTEGVIYSAQGPGLQPFQGIAIADLNGDGKTDLVSLGINSNAIDVLIGNADGTFPVSRERPGGVKSFRIAAVDVNHDGYPDVILANNGANSIRVLLGNGNGTFAPGVDYDVGATPDSFVMSDLNNDGNVDLIVTSVDGPLSVWFGNRDGTFAGKVDYAMGPTGSLLTADVNGDGKPDIMVVIPLSATDEGVIIDSSITALLGNGDGTFAVKADYLPGVHPGNIAASDLNGDHNIDLVVTSRVDSTPTIMLGDGTGKFFAGARYVTPLGSIVIADVNKNGKLDLVSSIGTVTKIMMGNGDGTFAADVNSILPASMMVADVTGDSNIDLVISSQGGAVGILTGDGDGTFQAMVNYPVVGAGPLSATVTDLNRDGLPDLVTNNYNDNTLGVLLGTCIP